MSIKELLDDSNAVYAVQLLERAVGNGQCKCCGGSGGSEGSGGSSSTWPSSSSSSECNITLTANITVKIRWRDGHESDAGTGKQGKMYFPVGRSTSHGLNTIDISLAADRIDWCCDDVEYAGYDVDPLAGIYIHVEHGSITRKDEEPCNAKLNNWSLTVNVSKDVPCDDKVTANITIYLRCKSCPAEYTMTTYLFLVFSGSYSLIANVGTTNGYISNKSKSGKIDSCTIGGYIPCEVSIVDTAPWGEIQGLDIGQRITGEIPEHSFTTKESIYCDDKLSFYEDIVVDARVKYRLCITTWYIPCGEEEASYVKGGTWCSSLQNKYTSDIHGVFDGSMLYITTPCTIIEPTPEHGETYVLEYIEQDEYSKICKYDKGTGEVTFMIPFDTCGGDTYTASLSAKFRATGC